MWDMVSKAKSSNPPLSKEIVLQTHGQDGDCWEDDDCQDGDHGHEHEEGDSSEESKQLTQQQHGGYGTSASLLLFK
jgi:hypothetical protein